MNVITGQATATSTYDGTGLDNITLGDASNTADTGVTSVTDTSTWFSGTDVDGANRPYKIRRTGVGDCFGLTDAGAVSFPQVTGGTDKYLAVDGSGDVTASVPVTVGAAGTPVTIAGANVEHDPTNQNLFIATDPSAIIVGSAQNNVGIGIRALDAVTSGDGNIALGSDALGSVNTGGHNISMGLNAATSLTGGSSNICIGKNTGQYMVTAASNTLVGFTAGSVVTGSDNTCIGATSGTSITTGGENTCLGRSADVVATLSNQTAIGKGAQCDAANQVQLGNTSVTQVRTSGAYYGSVPSHEVGAKLATPANRQLAYATDTGTVDIYNGSSWTTCLPAEYTATTADIAATNLVAWYDASDVATITESGGNLTQWDDKSGNGNHLDNIIGTPRYGDNTQNGIDVVTFTDDAISETTFTGIDYSDHCVVIACQMNTYNADTYFGTGANGAGDVMFNGLNTNVWRYHIWNDTPALEFVDTTTGMRSKMPSILIVRFINSTKTVEIWVNGLLVKSGVLTGTFGSSSRGFALGSVGVTEATTDYRVYEARVYDNSLTTSEINELFTHLSQKWQIPTVEHTYQPTVSIDMTSNQFVVPTAERLPAGKEGAIFYDKNTKKLRIYDGTLWRTVTST